MGRLVDCTRRCVRPTRFTGSMPRDAATTPPLSGRSPTCRQRTGAPAPRVKRERSALNRPQCRADPRAHPAHPRPHRTHPPRPSRDRTTMHRHPSRRTRQGLRQRQRNRRDSARAHAASAPDACATRCGTPLPDRPATPRRFTLDQRRRRRRRKRQNRARQTLWRERIGERRVALVEHRERVVDETAVGRKNQIAVRERERHREIALRRQLRRERRLAGQRRTRASTHRTLPHGDIGALLMRRDRQPAITRIGAASA